MHVEMNPEALAKALEAFCLQLVAANQSLGTLLRAALASAPAGEEWPVVDRNAADAVYSTLDELEDRVSELKVSDLPKDPVLADFLSRAGNAIGYTLATLSSTLDSPPRPATVHRSRSVSSMRMMEGCATIAGEILFPEGVEPISLDSNSPDLK